MTNGWTFSFLEMAQETYAPSLSRYSYPGAFIDSIKGTIVSAVGQPQEYASLEASDIQARRRDTGNHNLATWESKTYPARDVNGLGPRENALLVLPESASMKAYLRGFEAIREYYTLGTPVRPLWVPDLHEPPNVLDHAIASVAPDVARQLRRFSDTGPFTVITHANTPDTQEWIARLKEFGIPISPYFNLKDQIRPGNAYRHGFTSFAEGESPDTAFVVRNHIPAALGRAVYGSAEAAQAYRDVVSFSGNNTVYTKIDASGGGSYMGRDASEEEVASRIRMWEEQGKLDPIHGQRIPAEIQPLILGIRGIHSFQYVDDVIVTPGPGFTRQLFHGDEWQGNVYNAPSLEGIPHDQQEGVKALIGEFQRRIMSGLQREQKGNYHSTGGVDFALANIDEIPFPSAFIPRDMLQIARALQVPYMPIAIEHNGERMSDALWPALFAEQLGIIDRGLPFMAKYVSPTHSDLPAVWDYITRNNMQFTQEKGEGIVPMAWINDEKQGIHSASLLLVGSAEDRLQGVYEKAVALLQAEHLIGE